MRARFSWLLRAAKWTLVVLSGLLITGLLYARIGTTLDARRYPPPGRLVEVSGDLLHINCTGEGSPTVVLDTLSGGISSYWGWVQPEIAKTTRVCVYDRAGRAWSGAAPARTLAQGVETLHALLENAGEAAPYVMVGHSIGGLYAWSFAHTYPEEVAGVVLVDSSHPAQYARYPTLAAANREFLAMARFFPWVAHLGIARLYFDLGGQMDLGDLPPSSFAEAAAWWSRADYFASLVTETELAETNFAYAQATLTSMPNIPLAIVTADAQLFEGWSTLQDELAALNANSIHLRTPGSTHASLAFHPEHAHATAEVILQIVEAARARQAATQ